MNDGRIITYNMSGSGDFSDSPKQLLYINGNFVSNSTNLKKQNIASIKSYDAASGKINFGQKGEGGVILITTKS
jgi:hypothetical protein